MHLNRVIFGYTYNEIKKSFPESILYKFNNNINGNKLDLTIAKTIKGFSKFLDKESPDLVVIHGDWSGSFCRSDIGFYLRVYSWVILRVVKFLKY